MQEKQKTPILPRSSLLLPVLIGMGILSRGTNALAEENPPPADPTTTDAQTKSQPKPEIVTPTPEIVTPKPQPQPTAEMITVKTEKEVLVEQRDSATAAWRHVCASPCSFVPKGGQYRVIGVNVSPSEPFVLKGGGALDVTIGSAPLMRRGMWISGAAAGTLTLGLVLIASAAGFADLNEGQGPNGMLREEKIGALATGMFISLAGVALGLYGGSLFLDNRRSKVSGPLADTSVRSTGLLQSPFAFRF